MTPPILYMVFVFIVSSVPGSAYEILSIKSIIGNLLHIPLYGFLAFLWIRVFNLNKLPFKKAVTYTVLITVSYGVITELYQYFIPGRDMSLGDIAFNALGCIAGIFVYRKLFRGEVRA